jgi:hypothetical protein
MSELKLYGMRASFDEVAGKVLTRRDEIYPLIASLIRAERTHRQARSISYRIGGAKFPVLKDLDTFVFGDTPVDEGQVRELATGAFLDAKRNAIFIGGTGTGKTHLCIAVASAVIRTRARGHFFNLVDLVNQLEQEKAAGQATSNSAWSHWLTGRQSAASIIRIVNVESIHSALLVEGTVLGVARDFAGLKKRDYAVGAHVLQAMRNECEDDDDFAEDLGPP